MTHYVDIKKRSKKEQRALNNERRGSWNGVNPVTRVVPSKGRNAYNRNAAKREMLREAF